MPIIEQDNINVWSQAIDAFFTRHLGKPSSTIKENNSGKIYGLPNIGNSCHISAAVLILYSILRDQSQEVAWKFIGENDILKSLLYYVDKGNCQYFIKIY
jgi:hypothetical protein